MGLVLLLIIAAIALGLVGAIVKGLFYLLIIGVIVFVASLIYSAFRFKRGRRPSR